MIFFYWLDDAWSLTTGDTFDDDSVNVEIITKTSSDASGVFSVDFDVADGSSKSLMFPSVNKFDVSVENALNEVPETNPPLDAIVLSTESVDPRKSWNSLDGPTNQTYYTTFKGQTNILRYSLTFPNKAEYDINLKLKSIGDKPISFVMGDKMINRDRSVGIERLFVSRAGSNYPCVNGYSPKAFLEDDFTCVLPIGKINYFPIDEKNSSANNVLISYLSF